MIPFDRALEIVLAQCPALAAEQVGIAEVLGRVLAEDVRSDIDMPPFDRSAMDGYALRAADVTGAHVVLDVVSQIRAGQVAADSVGPGQAIQIMTGAPVPAGATAVQRVELTRAVDPRRVEILASLEAGTNIAARGCEVRVGDTVLSAGEMLDSAAIAVLAAAGGARVSVGRRPTLSLLVTGDELVGVDERPTGGRIRNANGHAIAAQARMLGIEVRDLGIVGDERDRLVEAIRSGLASDVLVISGGVSEGVFDLVEPALEQLDVKILFDKVAIRPGAPLVFGRRGDTLVFGLPGNPVSAQVTFNLFVRAAVLRMQGARIVSRPKVEIELLAGVANGSGRLAHLPARVGFEGGRFVARPIRSMGSADVVAHARANALVVLEPDRARAEAGERASAVLLGNFLDRDGAP